MDNVHARSIKARLLIALPGEGETFMAQRILTSEGLEIVLEPEIGGDAMLTASLVTRYPTEAQAVAAERARIREELLELVEPRLAALKLRNVGSRVDPLTVHDSATIGLLSELRRALDRICPPHDGNSSEK